MTDRKIFYRYDGYEYLKAIEYVCVKETPCGYWIRGHSWGCDKPRLIMKGARVSYAYTTKKKALESFIARKSGQIKHLSRQLSNAKDALAQAKKGQVDERAIFAITDEECLL